MALVQSPLLEGHPRSGASFWCLLPIIVVSDNKVHFVTPLDGLQATQTQLASRAGAGPGQALQGWDPSQWRLECLRLRGLALLLEPHTGRVFTRPTAAGPASGDAPQAAAWPAPVGVLAPDGAHVLDADDVFAAYAPLHGLPEDPRRRSQLQVTHVIWQRGHKSQHVCLEHLFGARARYIHESACELAAEFM